MRIALFSDNFYPELSGISDSIISLAKNLGERGHTVRFFVPAYADSDYVSGGSAKVEPDLGPNVSIERLRSLPYRVTGTGHARFVIPVALRARTVARFKPDVIHTQLFFGVGLEAVFASRSLRVPLVGTNHTAMKEFLKYSPLKVEWLDRALLNYVNWYYERCVTVTAPSQSVFDEMVELGFKHGDMQVVPNPIDTVTFHPAAAEERAALKKKLGFDGGPVVVHAGRLSDERHPDAVIRSFAIVRKEVPGAILAFAGKGSSEEKLRALAKEKGVDDAVKFLGFLSQQKLNDLYNAADVFAIASTSDTQSMVMMQAMASGIPIVGVRARGIPEYVNDQNGFLVEPGDEEGFAKRIISLLKESAAADRLGASARKYVEQFSAPAVAERWERIYAEAQHRYAERRYNKKYTA